MTDAKPNMEILAMALRKVYSSPQAAVMDGSYNRVKEAIILGIKESRIKMLKEFEKVLDDNVTNEIAGEIDTVAVYDWIKEELSEE